MTIQHFHLLKHAIFILHKQGSLCFTNRMFAQIKKIFIFVFALIWSVSQGIANEMDLQEIGHWYFGSLDKQYCGAVNQPYTEKELNGLSTDDYIAYATAVADGLMVKDKPLLEITYFPEYQVMGILILTSAKSFEIGQISDITLLFDGSKQLSTKAETPEKLARIIESWSVNNSLVLPPGYFAKNIAPLMKKHNSMDVKVNGKDIGSINLSGFTKTFNKIIECGSGPIKNMYDPFK